MKTCCIHGEYWTEQCPVCSENARLSESPPTPCSLPSVEGTWKVKACPFCGKPGYGRGGLKEHLLNECVGFRMTHAIPQAENAHADLSAASADKVRRVVGNSNTEDR